MNTTTNPIMHCHNELLADKDYSHFIPNDTILKWFNDRYSTSKHLLTLYSIARGLEAKSLIEIGFGRSSFVLAKAASENNGTLITCDTRDFSYLLNENEKKVTQFIHGKSELVWEKMNKTGIDFAFIDFFSWEGWTPEFVKTEMLSCMDLLKENGVLCIHDTLIEKYKLKNVFNSMKKQRFGFANNDFEFISLPYNYGLGIIRRLKPSRFGKLNDGFIKK